MTAHADVHAIPPDAQLIHDASSGCICEPTRPWGQDVWVHRALDSPHPVLTPPAGTEW